MKNVVLAVFFASTAVHLFATLRDETKLRNLTKPLLLLSLLGYYLLAARPVLPLVVLALAFSWLGDVLLIPKETKWFVSGGIAFLLSHVFFVLAYLRDIAFSRLPGLLILLLAAIFALAVAVIFSRLKPVLPKALFYPMLFYLLVNGAMNCFAILRCLSLHTPAAAVTAIGAALFFISDTVLFFIVFKKNSSRKTDFLIMLTYALGQFLIVCGLL